MRKSKPVITRTVRGAATSHKAAKPPTVHFTLRLPREIMNNLRKQARESKQTIAQVIVGKLEQHAACAPSLDPAPVRPDDPFTIRDMP